MTAKVTPLPTRVTWFLENPLIRIAVPVLIMGLTLFVLHKLATDVSWNDVKSDFGHATPRSIAFAIGWMVLSFAALSFYDVLAVRSVAPGQVPARIARYAGMAGTAISNLLGLSYLTGTAVRYRIYASLGLDLSKVAGLIATSWIAFWLGLLAILGVLLCAHPVGLSTVLPISPGFEMGLGLALLAALAGLFFWLARGGRRLTLGGFGFDLPAPGLAARLMGAGVGDLICAALTLYVLMPSDLAHSFPWFFVVFTGAIAFGVLSHAPGGLGVFEATMIAGLGAGGRSDVLAALVLYRLVYFVLPFIVAVASLAVIWLRNQRLAVGRSVSWVYRLARPIVPLASSGIALLAGTILLVSGNLPADDERLGVLRDILPMSFIEASHLVGSVTGLLLVVISRGLYRRLFRAWAIAMFLMGVGFVASLAKGLDWGEAASMLTTITLLGAFRSVFYRVETASVFRLNGAWMVSILALLAAVFWIGLFAYSHVDYSNELWWQFALHSDASRFLRASLVIALIMAGIALNSVLNTRTRPRGAMPIPDIVRKLVAQSEDAEAQIALLGDKNFLISDDGRAYISFGDTGRSLITKGEPVGDYDAGCQLIWQLREKADKAGKLCAFYAVTPRYLPTYLDLGLSILKIGEVARVDLQGFTLDGSEKKDFRHARSRMMRDGYVFSIIPSDEVAAILPELRGISDRWLASKQGEEKAFALGCFDEAYLGNFDHAVMRHTETGRITAFANLMRSAHHHELSLDLMRHDPDGPKMAMDALFGEMLMWGSAQGYRWFCLGAAPFAGLDNHQLSSLWNRIGGFVYAHGEQFYHFEGLRAFKQKFAPVWTPNYLACPGGLATPRVLYEVNTLISGGLRGLIR
ncbi:hypothetical protein P775_24140 [Puniceibacterium antarcticum]|uniref:Phosphatidylglycerol lysyltransferase C-terminal domain-containing protein n=1 Tax=Puniceibacterium antarcticum TaxID=1206336 RepID=A0A2G8R7I4_9RHOB|nr:bifunctional lysylphosphatidylglycerol flippase/synthetase MprF [Puniceibacterium antarcticum]PIL17482.1 hypothetical protein P775_24140 [Puniceibacterium antarcticum]